MERFSQRVPATVMRRNRRARMELLHLSELHRRSHPHRVYVSDVDRNRCVGCWFRSLLRLRNRPAKSSIPLRLWNASNGHRGQRRRRSPVRRLGRFIWGIHVHIFVRFDCPHCRRRHRCPHRYRLDGKLSLMVRWTKKDGRVLHHARKAPRRAFGRKNGWPPRVVV